jgi:hypothetical protein
MAVHELGHVIGAVISGGVVERVVLHPLTISRTDVSPNPHPGIVVWLGPVIGCLFPLALAWSVGGSKLLRPEGSKQPLPGAVRPRSTDRKFTSQALQGRHSESQHHGRNSSTASRPYRVQHKEPQARSLRWTSIRTWQSIRGLTAPGRGCADPSGPRRKATVEYKPQVDRTRAKI